MTTEVRLLVDVQRYIHLQEHYFFIIILAMFRCSVVIHKKGTTFSYSSSNTIQVSIILVLSIIQTEI